MISKIKKILVNKESIFQFIKYACTGLLGAVVEFTVFNLLMNVLTSNYSIISITISQYNIAHSASLISGAILCYIVNKIWSFNARGKNVTRTVKYFTVFSLNLLVTNLLLSFFIYQIGLLPVLAKLIIMCMAVCWNFLIYKFFVYK